MKRPSRAGGLKGLRQAFDEVRFGPRRTLNLRESLPTVSAAVSRSEAWLRQQQMDGAEEVLLVTGRGNNSEGGVSAVRQGVIVLLHALKRRGVVSSHEEHTQGSFVVTLAPVSALWESPPRNRDRGVAPPASMPPSLDDLQPETKTMLRNLAERSLEGLGVKDTAPFLQGEMLRHFGVIAASAEPTAGDSRFREDRLREAIRLALNEYE